MQLPTELAVRAAVLCGSAPQRASLGQSPFLLSTYPNAVSLGGPFVSSVRWPVGNEGDACGARMLFQMKGGTGVPWRRAVTLLLACSRFFFRHLRLPPTGKKGNSAVF